MTYKDFWLISINAEQRARTCGYWYLVQAHGSTAHTAFRSKSALLRWLGEFGLNPTAFIPDEGNHSSQRLLGSYSRVYAVDEAAFVALSGIPTRTLSNARYVDAKITRDASGHTTLHVAHFDERQEHDYPECEAFYCGRWDTPDSTKSAAA